MYYTAFSIQHLKKGTALRVVAAIVHEFGGCGQCTEENCECCAGGDKCREECKCHQGKSCGTCNFKVGGKTFKWVLAEMRRGVVFAIITRKEMMQIDVYTEVQFDFHGLRTLSEALRMFSDNGELTMTHVHRDALTEEHVA